jgi:surface carbohydrate biosynthesis protein
MKKKTIYVLIENEVRELYPLILFAIISSIRGYRVYIGTHYSILKLLKIKKSFGGIFINKGSLKLNDCILVKKKCNKLAILDQEISPGYSDYYYNYIVTARHYKNTLRYVDRYYCINDQVKKIAEKTILKENKKLKIISVGWPRFDVLNNKFKYVFDTSLKKLKKKYNKFILFNSDFGLVSEKDINVFNNTRIWKKTNKKFIDMHYKIRNSFRDHAIKDFAETKLFLSSLIKNLKNINIVIRPHPAESLNEWRSFCKTSKNFFLTKPITDVVPTIYASSHVLHRGCTTGYQSLVLKKKTGYLNLLKENSKTYHYRPSLFDLSKKIEKDSQFNFWLKEKNNFSKKNNNKLNNVLNIDNKLACEKILDDLDDCELSTENKHKKFQLYGNFEVKFDELKNEIYDLLVKIGLKKERNFLSKYKTQKIHKSFNEINIEKLINLFLKSEFFKDKCVKIKVNKISDILFEIDKIN